MRYVVSSSAAPKLRSADPLGAGRRGGDEGGMVGSSSLSSVSEFEVSLQFANQDANAAHVPCKNAVTCWHVGGLMTHSVCPYDPA